MDWLDLLAVQGTLKSLLQHHSSKASIFWLSAFFTVQLSHPYMTTGKTIALARRTFVGQVMSLLFNMISRLVITFLPRSKHLLVGIYFLRCSDFVKFRDIHFQWDTIWFVYFIHEDMEILGHREANRVQSMGFAPSLFPFKWESPETPTLLQLQGR